MNRMSIAVCLSLSAVAVVLSAFSLVRRPAGESDVDRAELRALAERFAALEARVSEQAALVTRGLVKEASGLTPGPAAAGRSDAEGAGVEAVTSATGLQRQVAALKDRLASLESGETIARLAQSGREQVAEQDLEDALDVTTDPEAEPHERLASWKTLRRLWASDKRLVIEATRARDVEERDLVLPLVDLAQDTTLEPHFRADIVRNLHGSRVEEIRQPLLDLFSSYDTSEVRGEALTALMWHLDDEIVRETITVASRDDRDEDVQARAREFLPKVEHVAERLARQETESDGSSAMDAAK